MFLTGPLILVNFLFSILTKLRKGVLVFEGPHKRGCESAQGLLSFCLSVKFTKWLRQTQMGVEVVSTLL